MADKGVKGKKDAAKKPETKGDVVVNVAESKGNEPLLDKDKRGRCDCRLPFTSRGEPKASPQLVDSPQKNAETSIFTYLLWVLLPLLAVGIVGYALYLAIHIANAPHTPHNLAQPQHVAQQPQFLEQMLENDEPVRISALSDEQLEAILAERKSQRESIMDSDGGDSDTDPDTSTDSADSSAAGEEDTDDNSATDAVAEAPAAAASEDNTELPQAPTEDDSSAAEDSNSDTDSSADTSLVEQHQAASSAETETADINEGEDEETPGAFPLGDNVNPNPAAATLFQLKASVHRRAQAQAQQH